MHKTTEINKMENHGLDYYSLGATLLYFLGGIFVDFQSTVIVLVGLSTLAYNVLRIYNEFLKKKKQKN